MAYENTRIFLSNDSTVSGGGIEANEELFTFNFASETSALAGSATLIPLVLAKQPGYIADVYIGVVAPSVSASGFVSGTVDAQVNINSAAVLSTLPAIAGVVGSAGQAVRKATNAGGGVSAVVNVASAQFSAGDAISINYNARSVGSAAAGAAGTGLYVAVKLRYKAR